MFAETTFPEIAKLVTKALDDVAGVPVDHWKYRGRCCICGHDLRGDMVYGYPHKGGFETPVGRYWLYVKCPLCGERTNIMLLGIVGGTKFGVV